MKLLLINIFFLLGIYAFGQAPSDSLHKNTHADPRLGVLLEKHTAINKALPARGYRIQIYFGNDKLKAKEVRSKYLTAFPKSKAYEIYEIPNFKVRVGDFRTRLDAYQFLKQLKLDFPGAFIVQSEIEIVLE